MLPQGKIEKIKKSFPEHADLLPGVFNALSDPGRFRIFRVLRQHQDICVTDVAHILNISVPAASQQLKILETHRLIRRERQGQRACYAIDADNAVVKALEKFLAQAEK